MANIQRAAALSPISLAVGQAMNPNQNQKFGWISPTMISSE
jgi:hypothetical protein